MSGSGASNLGYGGIKPFNNVNDSVNKLNVHDSASFTSKTIPNGGANGLSGIKDNVLAASGKVNSFSFFKGGGSKRKSSLRRKIKNIVKKYKMKTRRIRSRLRRRFLGSRRHKRKTRSMKYYGGYKQYMSDTAFGRGYSLGGPMEIAAGKNIALANPPLQHKYIGGGSGVPQLQTYPCTSGCMDNYNHYTKTCAQTPLK